MEIVSTILGNVLMVYAWGVFSATLLLCVALLFNMLPERYLDKVVDRVMYFLARSWGKCTSTRLNQVMLVSGTLLLSYCMYSFHGIWTMAAFLYAEVAYYSLGSVAYRIYPSK